MKKYLPPIFLVTMAFVYGCDNEDRINCAKKLNYKHCIDPMIEPWTRFDTNPKESDDDTSAKVSFKFLVENPTDVFEDEMTSNLTLNPDQSFQLQADQATDTEAFELTGTLPEQDPKQDWENSSNTDDRLTIASKKSWNFSLQDSIGFSYTHPDESKSSQSYSFAVGVVFDKDISIEVEDAVEIFLHNTADEDSISFSGTLEPSIGSSSWSDKNSPKSKYRTLKLVAADKWPEGATDFKLSFKTKDGEDEAIEFALRFIDCDAKGGVRVKDSTGCWFAGGEDDSCDDKCGDLGLIYDAETDAFAGSSGVNEQCMLVLDALNLGSDSDDFKGKSWGDGVGCFYNENKTTFENYRRGRDHTDTTSGGKKSNARRACACR